MKFTLLELTQNILSSMGSDEVNSIDDTEEASAIASIIKECYNEIVTRGNVPESWNSFELTATSSATPVLMTVPTGILEIKWLKYKTSLAADTDVLWSDIQFLPWEDFSRNMYNLNSGDTEVDSFEYIIGSDTLQILYRNDQMPTTYSTWDDYTLVFDAYDSDEETNLQKNKTICFGKKEPTFTLTDNFTPALNAEQFLILLSEAKSQAFAELKQTSNLNAERKARRGWISSINNKAKTESLPGIMTAPDYGRKGRRGRQSRVRFGNSW